MVYDTSLMTYADSANRRRLLDNPADKGRLVESTVGACLLARGKEEGFEVYWWHERGNAVDFVIKKGSQLTAFPNSSAKRWARSARGPTSGCTCLSDATPGIFGKDDQ